MSWPQAFASAVNALTTMVEILAALTVFALVLYMLAEKDSSNDEDDE